MTRLALLLTVLLLPPLAAQNTRGSIEGIVVHDPTGKPLADATVELTVVEGAKVVSRTTKTRDDGRYSFTNLPPASGYQLVVTGSRLWPTAYGQKRSRGPWTPLTLGPGERLTDIRIETPTVSQLAGRILDSKGAPLIGASVLAMRAFYGEGRRQLQRAASTIDNIRGEYRFSNLTAGRYYIRVSPRNDGTVDPLFTNPALFDRAGRARVSNVGETPGYPTVYYPGVPLESAKPVILEESQALEDLDITVAKVETGRVRGTIVNANGSKAQDVRIALVPAGSSPDSNWSRFYDSKDGTFDLRGVQPGMYFLNAGSGTDSARIAGRMVVEVKSGGSHTFNVRVSPGMSIAGQLVMDDRNTANPDFSNLFVHLDPNAAEPIDGTLSTLRNALPSASATVSEDGAFTLRDVLPWDYRVRVANIRGAYIKAIRRGSEDVLAAGTRAETTNTKPLEIVLATDGGRLDGRVTDASRKDVGNARVVLVPEVRSRHDLYQAVSTTPTGRFQMASIPPGRYKLFAWKSAPEASWLDPDFIGLYEQKGTPLEVQSEAAEFTELMLIPER
jgi:hypothetical protein